MFKFMKDRNQKPGPTNFWGMGADQLFSCQLQLVDIMEDVGLSVEEMTAMTVALKGLVAIRHALGNGGEIDWTVWEEKEEEA